MTLPCLVCAKADARFWFSRNGFDIHRCEGCLSAWVEPVPSAEFLTNFYRSAAGFETKDDAHSVSVTQRAARRRRKAVQRFKASGNVLDVGSGRGFFLAEMRAHSYEGVGIELNPEDAEAARARTGALVVERPFLEADFAPGSFDVINLDQCLEHLAEPEKVLGRVRELLTPHGILCVAVPNHGSVQSRAMGTHDPYITPPEHLFYYTPAGLRAMFTRVGFRVLRVDSCGELRGSSILNGVARIAPRPLQRALLRLAASPVERVVTTLAKPVTAALNAMKRGAVVEFVVGKE